MANKNTFDVNSYFKQELAKEDKRAGVTSGSSSNRSQIANSGFDAGSYFESELQKSNQPASYNYQPSTMEILQNTAKRTTSNPSAKYSDLVDQGNDIVLGGLRDYLDPKQITPTVGNTAGALQIKASDPAFGKLSPSVRISRQTAEQTKDEYLNTGLGLNLAKNERTNGTLNTKKMSDTEYGKYYDSQLDNSDSTLDSKKLASYRNVSKNIDFNENSSYNENSGDYDYQIVNNNRAFVNRMNANLGEANAYNDTVDSRYFMIDDERRIYNYLYQTEGKDKAEEYIRFITPELNRRNSTEAKQGASNLAEQNPALASAFSVLAKPVTSMEGFGTITGNYIANKITGNNSFDVNAPGLNNFYITQGIRENVSDNLTEKYGNLASFLYNTAMSSADNLLSLPIAGVASDFFSLAPMAAEAATQSAINAQERGLTDDQALLIGVISGVAECLTEKVSVDMLLDTIKTGGRQVVFELSKNALAEGSEEVVSDVINLIADIVVAKDKSEWNTEMQSYISAGYTEEEAFRMVLSNQIESSALSFLGGALSGAALGGGAGVINNVRYANDVEGVYNDLGVDLSDAEVQKQIIESGLQEDEKSLAYQNAEKLKQKSESGGKISSFDTLKQLYRNDESVSYTEMQKSELASNINKEISAEPTNLLAKVTSRLKGNFESLTEKTELSEQARAKVSSLIAEQFNPYTMKESEMLQAATAYTNGVLEGKKFDEIVSNNTSSVPTDVKRIIYNTAAMEELRAKGVEINEGQGRNLRILGSVQWDVSQNTSVKGSGVETKTRRIKTSEGIADKEIGSLTFGRQVTAYDFDLPEGMKVSNGNTYLLSSGSTASTRKAERLAKANGMKAVFFAGGDLKFTKKLDNGTNIPIDSRGVIHKGTIYVRVDDPQYTADQIAGHEIAHLFFEEKVDVEDTADYLKSQLGTKDFSTIYDEYKNVYYGSGSDDVEIKREMLCDLYGGMNIFKDLEDDVSEVSNYLANLINRSTDYVAEKVVEIKSGVNFQQNSNIFRESSVYDKEAKVKMGSLFSGAGTFDFALRNIVTHEFGVEKDAKISAIFHDNIGKVFAEDVRLIKFTDMLCDYLHASPVCKAFSNANTKKGETPLDIMTAKAVARAINEMKPKFVTVENVAGYQNSEAIKIIEKALKKNGYKWDNNIYNAHDYGGATTRERMFIRAVRDGELPPMPNKIQGKSWNEVCSDLIDSLPDSPLKENGYIENRWNKIKDKIDTTNPVLVLHGTKSETLTYAEWGKPCPTILAKSSEARVMMPDGTIKRATPRLLARIMGLPDSFNLGKAITRAYTVVGNGIPVELSQAVAGSLLTNTAETSKIRFSRVNAYGFYSKMEKDIESWKDGKYSADSVIPMLKKTGVKDEEIKWTGIATFFDGKKSATKEELLKFVNDNKFKFEEETLKDKREQIANITKRLEQLGVDDDYEEWYSPEDGYFDFDTFKIFMDTDLEHGYINKKAYNELIEIGKSVETNVTRWTGYTLPGGVNYREILFKVPGSSYSNDSMRSHWRRPGVLAHARIDDRLINDYNKVLFVEEIQSDWHNAGRKYGYKGENSVNEVGRENYEKLFKIHRLIGNEYDNPIQDPKFDESELISVLNVYLKSIKSEGLHISANESNGKKTYKLFRNGEVIAEGKVLDSFLKLADSQITSMIIDYNKYAFYEIADDAPFKKTYTDFVMKWLLRKAAEEGYDALAWAPGKIQEERWSSDYAEGYKIEYDQDIPKFMNKYGKQWGGKVTKSEDVVEGYEVWMFNIPQAMKDSVMNEGQPMFSRVLDETDREISRLKAENRKLKEKADYFKSQLHYVDRPSVDPKLLQSEVDNMLSNTILDKKAIGQEVISKANYLLKDIEGRWSEVDAWATDLARKIIGNSRQLVEDDNYSGIKKYLRTSKLHISDEMRKGINQWSSWMRQRFGTYRFVKVGGLNVHELYEELRNEYGDGYFPQSNAELGDADLLLTIDDLISELEPYSVNPYDDGVYATSIDIAMATDDLKNVIMDTMIEAVQIPQTYAEKQRIRREKEVREMHDKMLDRMNQALERERVSRKAEIDKITERQTVKEEKERARTLRLDITKKLNELNSMLLHATDKKHVPEKMKRPVALILDAISTESTLYTKDSLGNPAKVRGAITQRTMAFNELRAAYKQIAEEGLSVVNPDLLERDSVLDKYAETLGRNQKSIMEMNSTELREIYDILDDVKTIITTYNKLFNASRWQNVSEVADILRAENRDKDNRGKLGKAGQFLNLDMALPETYFNRLGSIGNYIFRIMREAQDREIMLYKEALDYSEKNFSNVDFRELDKQMVTVTLGGKEYTVPITFVMELYNLNGRPQAHEHLYGASGGIQFKSYKNNGKTIGRTSTIRGITRAEAYNAFAKLSAEQIRICDKMQKFVSGPLAEHGNEASMEVFGYRKFTDPRYWKISSLSNELVRNDEVGKENTSHKNMGSAKALTPKANTAVMVGSIFDTYSTSIMEMCGYAAWLSADEDLNRIRNYKFKSDGNRVDTVGDILDAVNGPGGANYWQRLMVDLNNGVKNDKNYFGGLTGAYKAASISANLRVFLQQPTAILRAGSMIDYKYILMGLRNPFGGWNKAKSNAPIALWKDWGYFDIGTGRQMKQLLFKDTSKLEAVKELGMKLPALGDSFGWGWLYTAVEAETKATHKELVPGSEQFNKVVSQRFTEIVDHTQVVDGVLQRSQIMRNPDGLVKMATAFMSEPIKQYNMVASALYDVQNTTGRENKAARSVFVRSLGAMLMAGVLNAFLKSVIDALRNSDRDKDYWQKVIDKLYGEAEEDGNIPFINMLTSNLGDELNPLSNIPYVKDVFSILQGYDVERMDMSTISEVVKSVQTFNKSLAGSGSYTIQSSLSNLFGSVAKFFGIPASNVKREIMSVINTIANSTNNYLLQYEITKFERNIDYSGNRSRFLDILENAYNNDKSQYETLRNRMIEDGMSEDAIDTRINKTTNKNTQKSDAYTSSMGKLQSSNLWSQATEEEQKTASNKLTQITNKNASTESAKEQREKADRFNKAGFSDTEYILYALALDMVNDDGGISNEELKEAIDMVADTQSEKAKMWDAAMPSREGSNPFR